MVPSLRQERLAEALLDPRITTKTEALIRAGYAPESASKNVSTIMSTKGVIAAREALEARRSDKARDIKKLAAKRVRRAIGDEQADPTFALSTWATAAKIESEYPDAEPEGVNVSATRDKLRRRYRRMFEWGLERARREFLVAKVALEPENAAYKLEESAE